MKLLMPCAAMVASLGTMVAASAIGQQNINDLRDGLRPVPTDGAPVSPVSGENHADASFLARVSNDQPITLPHPPIDQIPEMPMPEPDAPGLRPLADGPSTMTFHDAETGETYELPMPVPSGADFGQSVETEYRGFNNMVDTAIENSRAFGNMTLAGGLSTWPRSGNVKLVMRFTDNNGNFRWFACSGSMQDAGVVLTAAHCVYNRDSAINDWADIVYIYPAWDGVNNNGPFGAPDSDEVIQNFGAAFGSSFLAGSDYINNGDFDADLGLIRISRGSSRNIGMLTGWYAWAWGGSCGNAQSRTYNNFSYPSENCPLPGLHNGRDMYFWSGTIDSCPGNQFQLDTGGGNCFDTVWGGMSGSGMYYIDGDNRYVHAVCSNSNRNDVGRYTKLWEGFVNDMVDFENNTRGNTFDLEALQFRAGGSTSVFQGQALDAQATVSIVNATNANPPSNSYTLRVYLSTNNNISSADTLLATWNYTVDFDAMQTRTFNVPAPTIPLDTPPGTYWLGVVLDSGTDPWFSNNDTDTWDAQQITVNEAFADLEATQCTASPGTYYQGETISVTHRTWNYGDRPAENVRVEFRASTNTIISTFDTFMEERFYGTLGVDNSVWVISNVQIPPSLPPGNYYIGTIVETSTNELTTSNNWVSDTNTITVLECEADITGDGVVNFFDVSAFLTAFNNMDPIADWNNDGLFNFFDVSAFLNAFNTGCP